MMSDDKPGLNLWDGSRAANDHLIGELLNVLIKEIPPENWCNCRRETTFLSYLDETENKAERLGGREENKNTNTTSVVQSLHVAHG